MLRGPFIGFTFLFLYGKIISLVVAQDNMPVFVVAVELAQCRTGLLTEQRVVENHWFLPGGEVHHGDIWQVWISNLLDVRHGRF